MLTTSAVIEQGVSIKECIGCGFCCKQAQCSESVKLFGELKACQALLWHEGHKRYVCGLLYLIEYQDDDHVKALTIGDGCCSPCNDWRIDIKNRDGLQEVL